MDSKLRYTVPLFQAMLKDNLGYIYRGVFTKEISDSILSLTENNLSSQEESSKMKKRVYLILVEGLQNITRHQDDTQANAQNPYANGMFVIQKKEDKYFITTGNLILNDNISHIKKLINKINSLEKDELKLYYKKVLEEGTLSDKGGAGLGLIDMAKKSGNKLAYVFKKVDTNFSYFYLHTIPSLKNENINPENDSSLKNIVDIHKVLNNQHILMVFNGHFNQESLMNLLASVEGQMRGSEQEKKRMYYIVVEMLQNIVKHGYAFEDEHLGNQGIFFISDNNGEYKVTTGNYIKKEDVDRFKFKINDANKLSKDEIEKRFNEDVFDFEIDDSKKSGLGVLDLRIKSDQELKFYFDKINDEYSFITIQVTMKM